MIRQTRDKTRMHTSPYRPGGTRRHPTGIAWAHSLLPETVWRGYDLAICSLISGECKKTVDNDYESMVKFKPLPHRTAPKLVSDCLIRQCCFANDAGSLTRKNIPLNAAWPIRPLWCVAACLQPHPLPSPEELELSPSREVEISVRILANFIILVVVLFCWNAYNQKKHKIDWRFSK